MVTRVVIAGSGWTLAPLYRATGAAVDEVALADSPAPGPIDLLILTDGESPPDRRIASLTRAELQARFQRLTYAPFHLAARLRPQLAAARGTVVLLTRASATMGHADTAGRYLERPFRAAAHQLFRSLSVEWKPEGIRCLILAADPADADRIPAAIAAAPPADGPAVLTDLAGKTLGW